MKPRTFLSSLAFFACLGSGALAEDIVLADFDQADSPMFVRKAQADIQPSAAGEGNAAAYQAEGYATVMMIRFPRSKVLEILEQTPLLSGRAKATRDENQGTFLDVTLVINSDISGAPVYSPVETAHFNPLTSADGSFAFDLASLSTKDYPSLVEAAKEFAGGKGTFFQVGIVQHSPKGTPSKVTYDDIRLEGR